jgi:hypothetical protein
MYDQIEVRCGEVVPTLGREAFGGYTHGSSASRVNGWMYPAGMAPALATVKRSGATCRRRASARGDLQQLPVQRNSTRWMGLPPN